MSATSSTSSSVDHSSLLTQYKQVLSHITDSENPELEQTVVDEMVSLLNIDKSSPEVKKHIMGNTQDALTYCEIGLHLARHYSSKYNTDQEHSESHFENAKKYHKIATQQFGAGKYDRRGDACWNAGNFFESVSKMTTDTNEKEKLLLKADKYYKISAKSNSDFSFEAYNYSSYNDLSRVHSHLDDMKESPIHLEKVQSYKELAKQNMRQLTQFRRLKRKDNLIALSHHQTGEKILEELKSKPLSSDLKQQIHKLLEAKVQNWSHSKPEQTKIHLRTRSQLALVLADHYASKSDETKAEFYYKIAKYKFSIGKYDHEATAYLGHAKLLYDQYKKYPEYNSIKLEEAAKNYIQAAKSTAPLSPRTQEDSYEAYSKAAEIYNILTQNTHGDIRNTYKKKAITYSQKALSIKGEITPLKLENLERSILFPYQKTAVKILIQNSASPSSSDAPSSSYYSMCESQLPPRLRLKRAYADLNKE